MVAKRCACGCGEIIPRDADPRTKYVSVKHRERANKRAARRRERNSGKRLRADAKPVPREVSYRDADDYKEGRSRARRGKAYEEFCRTPYPQMIASSQMSASAAARALGEPEGNVSRWMVAWTEDETTRLANRGWSRDEEVEEALLSLRPFMERFHSDLIYAPYYDEWEAEVDGVVGTGGRLALLAPQRHSKTEFLIRYAQRRIAVDPDICILWIGRSKELAEESVGMLRQLLEQPEFCDAVLGPDQRFQPPARSGKSWTDEKFTVAQRSKVRKSPTVRALGIGGTTSGRDADIIIVDDPQEREDCESPSMREKQARWFFTTLLARKMEHTGIALITSRRHLEDIPGKIDRDHGDDWRMLTYRAHDPSCPIPETSEDKHVDCVLWPQLRSFKFLMGQKRADAAFFECNYQNNPRADHTVLLMAEHIEACKDPSRGLGDIPRGVTRLVAGIDPADSKPVAAVLWGYQPDGNGGDIRHVVDVIEAEAGVRGGRHILRTWRKRYGCSLFVLEKNMAVSWWQDTEIKDFLSREGVTLKEHYTDRVNKWSPSTGVVAMFARMRTEPPTITLPYRGADTRQVIDRLSRTFLLFDPDNAGNKHVDDDLPMAAWFPQPTMDAWRQASSQTAVTSYRQTPYVGRQTYVPRKTKLEVA